MNESKNQSALTENKGIEQPKMVHVQNAIDFKLKRKKILNTTNLVQGILKGNISCLSQAISIIESNNLAHFEMAQEIIQACLPFSSNSIRIGITGIPGVGKSTFIETFGNYIIQNERKVAVLAIDPTSSISKGSILGDKTRMEELVKNKNAYIRPSASSENLGGVAKKTRETIILCEAAGFDTIIIETVGVGQSETSVHGMVDFFILLQIAGAGDELQGIKRGIMEMADLVVINKADGENNIKAKLAKTEYARSLHLFAEKNSTWKPNVVTASALCFEGIVEIWKQIEDYIALTKQNGYFFENRNNQKINWLHETINENLVQQFYSNLNKIEQLNQIKKDILNQKISPYLAAKMLLK